MCLYPRLIKNKKYTATKKNGGIIPAVSDNRVLAVPVGCGECMECRKQKARMWQVRLLEDIKTAKNGKFITLTFTNEAITELYGHKKLIGRKGYELDNGAAKIGIRLFLERWRKKYKKSIRHWLVTELGHNGTENIHLHGILWTNSTLQDIKNTWQYGRVWEGKYVNEQTINYIVKYITKRDEKHKYYKSKIMTSAGIGSNYTNRKDAQLNKFNGIKTKETYTTRSGHKLALPTYWRNKIYNEKEREELWKQKLDENVRYVDREKIDISKDDEEYKRKLKIAQEKSKRMGYGDGVTDWNEKKYEEERRTLLQQARAQ